MEAATTRRGPGLALRALRFLGGQLVTVWAALALGYLFLPIAVMVLFSFNDIEGRFNFVWHGFSLDAWRHPFAVDGLEDAMLLSLEIAAISTVIATALGTFVALALTMTALHRSTMLLLFNPKLLRDDAGFQLSFLALAGLVCVYPIFKAIWQKIKWPKLKGLSDAWLITLSAQVFTLPILAYNFNQISLVAPIANLAVLWSLPILTISILGALVLSILWPSLAVLFFTPSLLLTKYILTAVKFFANFKYSHVEIDYLPIAWIILYYLSVIFILIKMRRFTDIIDEHF